jgi:hypothetical protein
VRWQSAVSQLFCCSNGTRQDVTLSPYLFTRHICELLVDLQSMQLGCNVGGMFINMLAYANYILLLALVWRALLRLIDTLFLHGVKIDITCNSQKSVCMRFNPKDCKKIITISFPTLSLNLCSCSLSLSSGI